MTRDIQPGAYALNDFDFERPKTQLAVKSTVKRKHAQAKFEVYDYPGEYLETNDGDAYARARIEALQAWHERLTGSGWHPQLDGSARRVRAIAPHHRREVTSVLVNADVIRNYLIIPITKKAIVNTSVKNMNTPLIG